MREQIFRNNDQDAHEQKIMRMEDEKNTSPIMHTEKEEPKMIDEDDGIRMTAEDEGMPKMSDGNEKIQMMKESAPLIPKMIDEDSSAIIATKKVEENIEQQNTTYIKSIDVLPPQYNYKGEFAWGINWITNAKNGWIIQRIENTFNFTDCDGEKLAIYNDPLLKTYWEAWEIKDGKIIDGDKQGNDLWGQGEVGTEILDVKREDNYKGTWSTNGTVYFESIIDKNVWKRNPDLGNLYYTTKGPNLKSSPKLIRRAAGEVYVCGPKSGWYHKKTK